MGGWNSTMPGFQSESSIPSSVPQSSSNDLVSRLVETISKPLPEGMIRAATLPVAGEHVGQIPSSLQTPIGPYQERPLDQRQVTGRGAATRQGIANTFTAASNALGTIVTKEAQIKQGHIRDAATRVLTAQQAIDEAKQAQEQATQAGDTQAALKYQEIVQQNQQARDAVFADPKMRKALQKGFNISYTDPQANKTEEHAAVQEALKNAKTMQERRQAMQQFQQQRNQQAGTAMGAAFEKSMPQGMGPNILAQQQLQQELAYRKSLQDSLKNLMTFKASVYRSDKMYDAAQVRTINQSILQQARFAQQDYLLGKRFDNSKLLLDKRFGQQISLIGIRAKQARELANQVYTDREFDPLTMRTKSEAVAQKYNNNYLADLSDLQKLIAARDAAFPGGATSSKAKNDPQTYQSYNVMIQNLEAMRDSDKERASHYTQTVSDINKSFNLSGAGYAGDTGDSTDKQSDSVGGGADFTDPLNWLGGSGEGDSTESDSTDQ